MKITLIILQSLDGIISQGQDDDLSWGTKEDKEFFRSKTKEIGTMIMGKTTFDKMPPQAFSDRKSLVFTFDPSEYADYKNSYGEVEFFNGSPSSAVEYLEQKGVKHAALIGGGNLNGQFLKAGLVDEMFITVAPRIFGEGVRGTGNVKLDIQHRLLDLTRISEQEILFHYEVVK